MATYSKKVSKTSRQIPSATDIKGITQLDALSCLLAGKSETRGRKQAAATSSSRRSDKHPTGPEQTRHDDPVQQCQRQTRYQTVAKDEDGGDVKDGARAGWCVGERPGEGCEGEEEAEQIGKRRVRGCVRVASFCSRERQRRRGAYERSCDVRFCLAC